MQTYYMIPRARNVEGLLSAQLSGPFIDRAVKGEFPKPDVTLSPLVFSIPNPETLASAIPVGLILRSYRLQNSAIESEHIPVGTSPRDVSDVLDCLFENIEDAWEQKFASEICRLIENRKVVDGAGLSATRNYLPIDLPRTSLFGRKISGFRRTSLASGFQLEVNPKYDRCPRQVLDFHPDTVHFLFPDLSKWAGSVTFKDASYSPKCEIERRRFFRVVMSVAAKPVRTDLGTLYTILPAGWRGWLFKTVWKLLGVKP